LYQSDLPIVKNLAAAKECAWLNPNLVDARSALAKLPVSEADVEDARARLLRFAPFISRRFPETKEAGGLIESPLREIPAMSEALRAGIRGRLFAKLDCDLPIAGSIKARGGIYEVLKHAETLALENGLLREGEDYSVLDTDEARAFFSRYAVQVGSTGNLGLSIGIMSAAVGFRVTVHMSADAKQWKKDLLRSKGVNVVEYGGDYSAAVAEGRRRSDADPMSYFIDDENSKDLFMGYAVAAKRLDGQLKAAGIPVDAAHPLFVYIPCGVGGGPGGIAFGLKLLYGNNVHVFFVEPVQAPCML
jgi:D-serine dehydratase